MLTQSIGSQIGNDTAIRNRFGIITPDKSRAAAMAAIAKAKSK